MNIKSIRKSLSLLLAVTLTLGALVFFAPMTALADVAGGAGPVGLPGTIAIGTASDSPTQVSFNGKLWQVIGYNGTGVASAANSMTLLLANGQTYTTSLFSTVNNDYSGSALQAAMDTAASTLPVEEKLLIVLTNLTGSSSSTSGDGMAGVDVNNALFWPLNVSEANQVNRTVLAFSEDWWLRSPGNFNTNAAVVDDTGIVNASGDGFSLTRAVRPAFNLNLSSVLFTSGAASDGAVDVSPLATFTPPTSPLKFTALDSTFSDGFAITESAASGTPGTAVTLNYTGAATGTSHFIRVKLVSDIAPEQIAYMAVPVSNITAVGDSFSLTLPAGMPMGNYTAYVWVEEGNGAKFANRGSVPDTFALTVQPGITFSPSPGSINLSNPTNLVFQADAPALLSGYTISGVAFQNVTAGTGFGRALDASDGITYNPATGALTVPAAAFGQHASVGGGSPLTPGTYRAQIAFWGGVSFYPNYYADFEITGMVLSSSKDITTFSINGVNGTITDGSPNTITFTFPYGMDVTNLVPSITHTGASVSPASGVAQNFNSPATYTVTAQDGSTKDYIVTVNNGMPGTTITGLPSSHTLYKGGQVSWAPAPAGGTWDYDSDYLSMTKDGDKVTFKALKAGKTEATYTVNGVSHTVSITINESTIPQTGDNGDITLWLTLMLAAFCGMGAILFVRKKKEHADRA